MGGEDDLEFLLTGKIPVFWSPQACKTSIPWAFYACQTQFGTGAEQGLNRDLTGKEQGINRRRLASFCRGKNGPLGRSRITGSHPICTPRGAPGVHPIRPHLAALRPQGLTPLTPG